MGCLAQDDAKYYHMVTAINAARGNQFNVPIRYPRRLRARIGSLPPDMFFHLQAGWDNTRLR